MHHSWLNFLFWLFNQLFTYPNEHWKSWLLKLSVRSLINLNTKISPLAQASSSPHWTHLEAPASGQGQPPGAQQGQEWAGWPGHVQPGHRDTWGEQLVIVATAGQLLSKWRVESLMLLGLACPHLTPPWSTCPRGRAWCAAPAGCRSRWGRRGQGARPSSPTSTSRWGRSGQTWPGVNRLIKLFITTFQL